MPNITANVQAPRTPDFFNSLAPTCSGSEPPDLGRVRSEYGSVVHLDEIANCPPLPRTVLEAFTRNLQRTPKAEAR